MIQGRFYMVSCDTNVVKTSNIDTPNKKSNYFYKIGGIYVGTSVYYLSSLTSRMLSSTPAFKKLDSNFNKLSEDQFVQVGEAVNNVIKSTGLDKKGLEIIKITSKNLNKTIDALVKEISKRKTNIIQIQDLVNACASVVTNDTAYYLKKINKIVMPEKGLDLVAFHEIGHAMNYVGGNKIIKALEASTGLACLAAPIAMIALFKNKKSQDEKPKNKIDAIGDFIKNNAGKLSFAIYTPMLIEEGLASIRGAKAAKQFLSPELLKNVNRMNMLGFMSYLTFAVGSSVGLTLGVKLKDKIARMENKDK